jgi:hypothetical protein
VLVTIATPAWPGQLRGDPADDDPAWNEEQPRPDERDRQQWRRPDEPEGDRQPEDQRDDLRRGQRVDPEAVVGGLLH